MSIFKINSIIHILPLDEPNHSAKEQEKSFEILVKLILDPDFSSIPCSAFADILSWNLILLKDRTIFNLKNFEDVSQKSFSKLGFKKLKEAQRERFFEVTSMILIQVLKFIKHDFSDEKI